MAEEPENLVLMMLRRMDEKLDIIAAKLDDFIERLEIAPSTSHCGPVEPSH
ncbi:MAG: hypothetical protein JWR75_315 [Devosia sp.]|nr:hypothetical protein [Devosia sp.]